MQPQTVGFPLPAELPGSAAIQRAGRLCRAGTARGWGPMLGKAVAVALAGAISLAGAGARAQDGESDAPATAEQLIEVAREVWRAPGARGRCRAPDPNEIVVCQESREDFRVESPTDEAIRTGRPMPDSVPRAPYVLGLPECGVEVVCHRIGRPPERPLMIDLAALPHALTPEEAARVFRAEDRPPVPASPAAASPAAAP